MVREAFAEYFTQGYDIRPTIAVTKAHIHMPEIVAAIAAGRLKPDGTILRQGGDCVVTKAALEPVWYLPGVAKRFGCSESELRRILFEQTGGMFPELVTRGDLEVFLPPIGGMTVYIFGDAANLPDPPCRWPRACTTSATARTCSARTSVPAGPISRTASRSASAPRSRAAPASSSTSARRAAPWAR